LALNSKYSSKETIKGEFLVPDYYKDFTCKGGSCRDSCCQEWKVTIPMDQYFLLNGLNCKKTIKQKIDRTFRPFINPTPERYAEIVHTQDGNCPLHKEDGYCLLHETCGENVLPLVCRYYPRGPKINYINEVSCANSCEKTLELLFSTNEIIKFEKLNLKFHMNKYESQISDEKKRLYQEVRFDIFGLLSNRDIPLSKRILDLGVYLDTLDKHSNINILNTNDKHDIIKIETVNDYYQIIWKLFDRFNGKYPRLEAQLEEAKSLYINKDVNEIYFLAKKNFESLFSNHEIMFEKVIINDLFFKQFPFQTNFNVKDQYIALCGTYILLRYLSISLMYTKTTIEDFIDLISKTYTVISHSSFDAVISTFIRQLNLENHYTLAKIMQM